MLATELAVVLRMGRVADDFVIGLGPTIERAEQIEPHAPHVEFVEMAAAAGREEGHQPVAGHANFLAGVEIVVVGVDLHPPRRPADGRLEQRVGGNQVVVDGVPQMGQIKSAKGPVPIGAVALAAVEFRARLVDEVGPLDGLLLGGDLLQPLADLQHPRVHLVGFGILHAEVAPGAAADVGTQRVPVRVVLLAAWTSCSNSASRSDGKAHSVISR